MEYEPIENTEIENDEVEKETDEVEPPPKKLRKFNVEDLRQNLTTKTAYEAIKDFLQLCTDDESSHDYLSEYLDAGGSCSEILHVIDKSDNKNASYALPVLQVFNRVLLKIIAYYPQQHLPAAESCRVLLNKHYSIIKGMLAITSTPKMRKTALKLLSTMVTVSAGLAKEVLVHVAFDRTELNLLTTPSKSDDETSIRIKFIHFLIAFLVEGNTITIINLLEKRGLFGSIFRNLIYDDHELVVMVLSTIKTKILDNRAVSKTIKMITFNTQIIQSLINLYNWKGPTNYMPFKSNENRAVIVDQKKKKYVSEATHEVLLLLCTSHRNGVIFHDPLIGLGNKNINTLLISVIESLSKPWEHTYASELITKICVACPDLVKHVLISVEPYLEPRLSTKWTVVVQFVKQLIEALKPECVAQFLPGLNVKLIANLIQCFCVPKSVLQVITSETISHVHIGIRHESILLLFTMIEAIENYLNFVKNLDVFTAENQVTLKGLVTDYLNKNLPSASIILTDWQKSVQTSTDDAPVDTEIEVSVPVPNLNDHLSKLLEILYKYNTLCPLLVDHITKELNANEFLKTIEQLSADEIETAEMQIKAINLLLICDQTLFKPSEPLFAYTLPLLLKLYYNNTDSLQLKIETTLINLLTTTGIFEGCLPEITIWLHSILELESFTDEIGSFLITAITNTSKYFLKYITELSIINESNSDENCYNIAEIIESLEIDVATTKNQFRATHLSPLVYGIIECLNQNHLESIGCYLNCAFAHLLHSQTSPNLLMNLLLRNQSIIDKSLIKYIKSYQECTDLVSLKKVYKQSNLITGFSKALINDSKDLTHLLEHGEWKYYHAKLITRLVMFIFTQTALKKSLTSAGKTKSLDTIIHVFKCDPENLFLNLDAVLKHPVLLQNFIPMDDNTTESLCTDFVLEIIKELLKTKTISDLELYLGQFRIKLVRRLHVTLRKKHKTHFKNLMDIVRLLNLTHEQCAEVLTLIGDLKLDEIDSIILELLIYILNHTRETKAKPFSDETISKISIHLYNLNNSEAIIDEFETSLCNYITQYPHSNCCFGPNIFESLISKPLTNKSTAKLSALLLQCNPKLLQNFESNFDKILDKRELIFSLLTATINSDCEQIVALRAKVYKAHEQIILKFLNKPQKAANYLIDNYRIVIKLLDSNMSDEDSMNFVLKSHKFDVSETYHVEMLTTVYKRHFTSEKDNNKIISNYITTSSNLLINLLKRAEKSEEDWTKIRLITNELCMQLIKMKNVYKVKFNDEALLQSAMFQMLSKLCLKFGLNDTPDLVNLLKHLCNLTTTQNTDVAILFEMAISHSESLNILLSEHPLKLSLVNLLLCLCKKCPSVMTKTHIPVLLGAYQGTLSLSDQSLLQLLALYEAANVGFHEYRPYLWGEAAVGHYSVRFGVETILWRQPKPKEVLDLFNEASIFKTITNFPRSRTLNPETFVYDAGALDVYDPAFYLPLLDHLLVTESTVRWYQCVQRGILALVIVALTSECSEVRGAASHVLTRFHGHVEAARTGNQRLLWLHFVEATCRGTSALVDLRLSTIAAVFLARSAMIFTQPEHILYGALGNYIMTKECPDFTIIPELLPMLHSAAVKHILHRNFILEVIRDGLCTENDLKVMFRSVAFKLIMDLYNSVLINNEGQHIILQIISKVVSIPTGAKTLVSSYSLISWLNTLSSHAGSNNQTNILIDILNNLVTAYGLDIKYIKFNVLVLLVQFITNLKSAQLRLCYLVKFIRMLRTVYELFPSILNREQLDDLLTISAKMFDCNVCHYYLEYGSEFVQTPDLESDSLEHQGCYYLKLLTLKWIKTNSVGEQNDNA